MHQAGMVATDGEDLADDVLLPDVALGNMFDGHASSTGQFVQAERVWARFIATLLDRRATHRA
jgi:hypothetical protein